MEKIKQHLYRHFDERGNLLYVGVSLSTIQRLAQHRYHSHWFNSISKVTIEQFPSREEALNAERTAIQKEEPLHNVALKNISRNDFLYHKLRVTEDKREDSRVHLVNSVVKYQPMYTFADAAHLFEVGPSKIIQWCEVGKLGYVVIQKKWSERYNKWQIKKRITGWQIIDFIENLEVKQQLHNKGENASIQ